MFSRNTRQRNAIQETFRQNDRPLRPDEVLIHSQQTVEGIGIATVYRTIRTLVDDGWLVEVHLPGEPARFELAGKEHHHHFRCNQCERVFELAGCETDFRRLAPKGFQVTQHDITLFGLCAECGSAARAVVSRRSAAR